MRLAEHFPLTRTAWQRLKRAIADCYITRTETFYSSRPMTLEQRKHFDAAMTTDNELPVDAGLVKELLEELPDIAGRSHYWGRLVQRSADTITHLRAAIASSDENVGRYILVLREADANGCISYWDHVRAVLAAIRQKAAKPQGDQHDR